MSLATKHSNKGCKRRNVITLRCNVKKVKDSKSSFITPTIKISSYVSWPFSSLTMHSLYSFCGCPFYYVLLFFVLVLSLTLMEYQISSHKFNIHKTSWETFKRRCCNNVFKKEKTWMEYFVLWWKVCCSDDNRFLTIAWM